MRSPDKLKTLKTLLETPDKLKHLSSITMPMVTKLVRMVTYGKELP